MNRGDAADAAHLLCCPVQNSFHHASVSAVPNSALLPSLTISHLYSVYLASTMEVRVKIRVPRTLAVPVNSAAPAAGADRSDSGIPADASAVSAPSANASTGSQSATASQSPISAGDEASASASGLFAFETNQPASATVLKSDSSTAGDAATKNSEHHLYAPFLHNQSSRPLRAASFLTNE